MEYTTVIEETFLDYPSPDGNAIILYFTGCVHHCPGCHSSALQKIVKYAETKEEIAEKLINFAKRAETNKLVFLGGDPLLDSNFEITKYLVHTLSNDYDICIFTGYDIDTVKHLNLHGVKYWKCGKFIQDQYRTPKKTDEEYVLASPNQDFYDGNYNKLSENGILKF